MSHQSLPALDYSVGTLVVHSWCTDPMCLVGRDLVVTLISVCCRKCSRLLT